MNEHSNDADRGQSSGHGSEKPQFGDEQRDLLISRVIDGAATPEDWSALRAIAADDPSVWSDLADSQQDFADLVGALDDELAPAMGVEAPVHARYEHQLDNRLRRVGSWGGWAAAAAVALAWTLGPFQVQTGPGETITAGPNPNMYRVDSPEDALDLYVNKGAESGQVVAEMPAKIILEARPNTEGTGYEVLYYRQILERAFIPDVMDFQGLDAEGNPVLQPGDLGVGRAL